ncbi:phosphatidylinositol-specific phospholipase C/glycerophosphodiester phosphodiesterase family protein [Streptomyces sp. NPDC056796]|uniref:phosphatidylinositol-specific phospholipase C/glycerophosphodiester phosphodiesterase family protein n=1 Tax=unclassified Streptomyces TaxID=2593676 RepID=UPI0036B7B9B4
MAHLTRRRVVTTALATAAAGAFIPARSAAAAPAASARPRGPRPLARAHAHNDYLHPRPLYDALAHGFTSVEADIFLVGGELLVAHEAESLDPARTLSSLYLDPLLATVRANHGRVHAGHPGPLQLLIDIKTDGAATYPVLDRVLTRYRRILTRCAQGRVRAGAVTAVVSGDRAARTPMETRTTRYAFYDGRPDDLGTAAPASFIPLISTNWATAFDWQGAGPFPAAERERLRTFVTAAHARGQRVRFWGTPDTAGPGREAVWTELLAAGVDHLNTDDLAGLETFLRRREAGGRGTG